MSTRQLYKLSPQPLNDSGSDFSDTASQCSEYGYSALHAAVISRDLEYLDSLLLIGCELEQRDSNGFTALHVATLERSTEVVRKLIQAGSDPTCLTWEGMSAFHIASENLGCTDILSILGSCGRAGLNLTNKVGHTALHLAARLGSIDYLRILLDSGCDREITDKFRAKAVDVARKYGNVECAEFLLRYKPDKPCIQILKKKPEMFGNGWNSLLHQDDDPKGSDSSRVNGTGCVNGSTNKGCVFKDKELCLGEKNDLCKREKSLTDPSLSLETRTSELEAPALLQNRVNNETNAHCVQRSSDSQSRTNDEIDKPVEHFEGKHWLSPWTHVRRTGGIVSNETERDSGIASSAEGSICMRSDDSDSYPDDSESDDNVWKQIWGRDSNEGNDMPLEIVHNVDELERQCSSEVYYFNEIFDSKITEDEIDIYRYFRSCNEENNRPSRLEDNVDYELPKNSTQDEMNSNLKYLKEKEELHACINFDIVERPRSSLSDEKDVKIGETSSGVEERETLAESKEHEVNDSKYNIKENDYQLNVEIVEEYETTGRKGAEYQVDDGDEVTTREDPVHDCYQVQTVDRDEGKGHAKTDSERKDVKVSDRIEKEHVVEVVVNGGFHDHGVAESDCENLPGDIDHDQDYKVYHADEIADNSQENVGEDQDKHTSVSNMDSFGELLIVDEGTAEGIYGTNSCLSARGDAQCIAVGKSKDRRDDFRVKDAEEILHNVLLVIESKGGEGKKDGDIVSERNLERTPNDVMEKETADGNKDQEINNKNGKQTSDRIVQCSEMLGTPTEGIEGKVVYQDKNEALEGYKKRHSADVDESAQRFVGDENREESDTANRGFNATSLREISEEDMYEETSNEDGSCCENLCETKKEQAVDSIEEGEVVEGADITEEGTTDGIYHRNTRISSVTDVFPRVIDAEMCDKNIDGIVANKGKEQEYDTLLQTEEESADNIRILNICDEGGSHLKMTDGMFCEESVNEDIDEDNNYKRGVVDIIKGITKENANNHLEHDLRPGNVDGSTNYVGKQIEQQVIDCTDGSIEETKMSHGDTKSAKGEVIDENMLRVSDSPFVYCNKERQIALPTEVEQNNNPAAYQGKEGEGIHTVISHIHHDIEEDNVCRGRNGSENGEEQQPLVAYERENVDQMEVGVVNDNDIADGIVHKPSCKVTLETTLETYDKNIGEDMIRHHGGHSFGDNIEQCTPGFQKEDETVLCISEVIVIDDDDQMTGGGFPRDDSHKISDPHSSTVNTSHVGETSDSGKRGNNPEHEMKTGTVSKPMVKHEGGEELAGGNSDQTSDDERRGEFGSNHQVPIQEIINVKQGKVIDIRKDEDAKRKGQAMGNENKKEETNVTDLDEGCFARHKKQVPAFENSKTASSVDQEAFDLPTVDTDKDVAASAVGKEASSLNNDLEPEVTKEESRNDCYETLTRETDFDLKGSVLKVLTQQKPSLVSLLTTNGEHADKKLQKELLVDEGLQEKKLVRNVFEKTRAPCPEQDRLTLSTSHACARSSSEGDAIQAANLDHLKLSTWKSNSWPSNLWEKTGLPSRDMLSKLLLSIRASIPEETYTHPDYRRRCLSLPPDMKLTTETLHWTAGDFAAFVVRVSTEFQTRPKVVLLLVNAAADIAFNKEALLPKEVAFSLLEKSHMLEKKVERNSLGCFLKVGHLRSFLSITEHIARRESTPVSLSKYCLDLLLRYPHGLSIVVVHRISFLEFLITMYFSYSSPSETDIAKIFMAICATFESSPSELYPCTDLVVGEAMTAKELDNMALCTQILTWMDLLKSEKKIHHSSNLKGPLLALCHTFAQPYFPRTLAGVFVAFLSKPNCRLLEYSGLLKKALRAAFLKEILPNSAKEGTQVIGKGLKRISDVFAHTQFWETADNCFDALLVRVSELQDCSSWELAESLLVYLGFLKSEIPVEPTRELSYALKLISLAVNRDRLSATSKDVLAVFLKKPNTKLASCEVEVADLLDCLAEKQ